MSTTQQTNTGRSEKAEKLGAEMILQILDGEDTVGAEEEALLLEEDGSAVDSEQQQQVFENLERAAKEEGVWNGKKQGDFVDVPQKIWLEGGSWIEPDAGAPEVEMVTPTSKELTGPGSVQQSLRGARNVVERAVGIYNRGNDKSVELRQEPTAPGMVSDEMAESVGEEFYTRRLLDGRVDEENLDEKAREHTSEALKDRIAQHNRVLVDDEGRPMAFPLYGTASLQLTGSPRKDLDDGLKEALKDVEPEEVEERAEDEDLLTALREELGEVTYKQALDAMDYHVSQLHGNEEGPASTALTDFVFADFYGSPQIEDGEVVNRSVRQQAYRQGLNHDDTEAFDEPVAGDNPRIREIDSLDGFINFLEGLYVEFAPEKSAGDLGIAEESGLEEGDCVTAAVPAEVTAPYKRLQEDEEVVEVMLMYEDDGVVEETRTEMRTDELSLPVDNWWVDPRMRPGARGALEIRTLPNIDFDYEDVKDTSTASAFRDAYGESLACDLIDNWRQDMIYMADGFIANLLRIQKKFDDEGVEEINCQESLEMSRELAAEGSEDFQCKGLDRDEVMYGEGGIVDMVSDYLEEERGVDADDFVRRTRMRAGYNPDGENMEWRPTPAHLQAEVYDARYGDAA